ncbi:uncharacterized protein AMSG_05943 [Thecamonas trahens ATCC 50062]|uniref:Uncharacterized protein n=1 Tax=Thecamonas trahens ATCC 50062 TaxID=461836 RepID=A0A0L0DBG9_THETB|nr:hypothetical protein AMSG_05943 [Thecamonas trahens ATCC 50062]KNC49682.1 hypothetical protein AMSG_05943 [Thecamonas trahens ATCC 50062]|eukprot:XP_013757478.1 hypothetical protein AMSG_05943 [Thecamonas trahens ATCC 50062]
MSEAQAAAAVATAMANGSASGGAVGGASGGSPLAIAAALRRASPQRGLSGPGDGPAGAPPPDMPEAESLMVVRLAWEVLFTFAAVVACALDVDTASPMHTVLALRALPRLPQAVVADLLDRHLARALAALVHPSLLVRAAAVDSLAAAALVTVDAEMQSEIWTSIAERVFDTDDKVAARAFAALAQLITTAPMSNAASKVALVLLRRYELALQRFSHLKFGPRTSAVVALAFAAQHAARLLAADEAVAVGAEHMDSQAVLVYELVETHLLPLLKCGDVALVYEVGTRVVALAQGVEMQALWTLQVVLAWLDVLLVGSATAAFPRLLADIVSLVHVVDSRYLLRVMIKILKAVQALGCAGDRLRAASLVFASVLEQTAASKLKAAATPGGTGSGSHSLAALQVTQLQELFADPWLASLWTASQPSLFREELAAALLRQAAVPLIKLAAALDESNHALLGVWLVVAVELLHSNVRVLTWATQARWLAAKAYLDLLEVTCRVHGLPASENRGNPAHARLKAKLQRVLDEVLAQVDALPPQVQSSALATLAQFVSLNDSQLDRAKRLVMGIAYRLHDAPRLALATALAGAEASAGMLGASGGSHSSEGTAGRPPPSSILLEALLILAVRLPLVTPLVRGTLVSLQRGSSKRPVARDVAKTHLAMLDHLAAALPDKMHPVHNPAAAFPATGGSSGGHAAFDGNVAVAVGAAGSDLGALSVVRVISAPAALGRPGRSRIVFRLRGSNRTQLLISHLQVRLGIGGQLAHADVGNEAFVRTFEDVAPGATFELELPLTVTGFAGNSIDVHLQFFPDAVRPSERGTARALERTSLHHGLERRSLRVHCTPYPVLLSTFLCPVVGVDGGRGWTPAAYHEVWAGLTASMALTARTSEGARPEDVREALDTSRLTLVSFAVTPTDGAFQAMAVAATWFGDVLALAVHALPDRSCGRYAARVEFRGSSARVLGVVADDADEWMATIGLETAAGGRRQAADGVFSSVEPSCRRGWRRASSGGEAGARFDDAAVALWEAARAQGKA